MITASPKNVFDALGGFSRRRMPTERCDLCGAGVGAGHAHLLEVQSGHIVCGCDPCATLFAHREDGRKLIRIPRDARRLDAFELNDARWTSLRLPIDLAFFVRNLTADRMVAYYPSPAGSIESQLSLDAWNEIVRENPALNTMEPGVEALLVERTRGHQRQFIVPIDHCYRLTGLIRKDWRGFSGGDAVWQKVDGFFQELEERAHA